MRPPTDEDRVAVHALARWLRLLRLLFTVILLAVGVWRTLGGPALIP